jgi:hypothetical protein
VVGKKSGIFFTREGERPVRDFRGTRAKACYALLFAMCCAGAFPERVAMTISGQKTRSVCDHYKGRQQE